MRLFTPQRTPFFSFPLSRTGLARAPEIMRRYASLVLCGYVLIGTPESLLRDLALPNINSVPRNGFHLGR